MFLGMTMNILLDLGQNAMAPVKQIEKVDIVQVVENMIVIDGATIEAMTEGIGEGGTQEILETLEIDGVVLIGTRVNMVSISKYVTNFKLLFTD